MSPPHFKTFPTPRRWPWRACNAAGSKNPCPTRGHPTNKIGRPHTGHTNRPSFMISQPMSYSISIVNAFDVSRRGSNCNGPPKTTYLSKPVNIFGRWSGAPGGSGSPPKNRF